MTKKIILAAIAMAWVFAATASRGGAQSAAIAQVPGITATCTVPPGEKPWMVTSQTPTCRALEALAAMTQDEKLAFRGSLPRLGLVNGGGSDGPHGIAGGGGRGGAAPPPRALGVTLFPSEQVLAATWDRSLAKRRSPALLSIAFGFVALFLSAIGIYGVLAYLVTQRTKEIGIRVALGSTAWAVFQLVLREGLLLVAAGLAAGGIGSYLLRRTLESQLFGVTSSNPVVLVLVSVVLAAVALVACALPARRATKIDPLVALTE